MRKREAHLYIADIASAINKILKYVKGLSFEEFKKDDRTIDAVLRNLEVIGEAGYNLPTKFKDQHKQIPWNKIVTMRHKLIHEYFGVDEAIIWQTVMEDLKKLKKQINGLAH